MMNLESKGLKCFAYRHRVYWEHQTQECELGSKLVCLMNVLLFLKLLMQLLQVCLGC